jgi:ParB family chromosome partitioning protein
VRVSLILPDDRNRAIGEDEEFTALVESVRVLGVLQPLHVYGLDDGHFRLIDGERRWRAALKASLESVPCDVWPAGTSAQDIQVAGLVLNEHRQAHGCIAVARRLRDIKNEFGLTQEELAVRTGLPLDRIKTYGSLFRGSDALIEFLEENDVPLKVALELVRYERATNEARTRKLTARYLDSPLTRHQIAALRRRAATEKEPSSESSPPVLRSTFAARVERAFERDPERARNELEGVLARLGFRMIPAGAPPSPSSGPGTLS